MNGRQLPKTPLPSMWIQLSDNATYRAFEHIACSANRTFRGRNRFPVMSGDDAVYIFFGVGHVAVLSLDQCG
jgi:hypothetical protein